MREHILDLVLFPSARRRRRERLARRRAAIRDGATGPDWRLGYYTEDRTDLPYPPPRLRLVR